MSSTVRIPWSIETEMGGYWNEVCAWAVERFGLPGDRFIAHANIAYMDFIFESNKDALVMAIMWNAKIVPGDQITVELVGNLLQ